MNGNYKVKINNPEEISEFQIKMISKNNLNGLVNFKVDYNNDEIRYDTLDCKSVSECMDDINVIKKVINKAYELYKMIDEYMLNISNLECSTSRIYIDDNYDVRFIYYPFKMLHDENQSMTYKKLIEDLFNIYVIKAPRDHEIKKIKKILSSEDYEIEDLCSIICDSKANDKACTKPYTKFYNLVKIIIMISLVVTICYLKLSSSYSRELIIAIMSFLIVMITAKIIHTKVKDKEEKMMRSHDTQIIYDSSYITSIIQFKKTFITKDKFTIGKSTDCDLIIKDKTISNEHAIIYKYNNHLFLKDLNSKNHTYVNDVMLEKNEKLKLCDKDVIRFSSKKYVVHIR